MSDLEIKYADYTCELQKVITPRLAQRWLEFSKDRFTNRKVNPSVVALYAADIQDDSWFERNGASIIFDQYGILIDGQHRLKACIRANRSFISDVKYGADRASFISIDKGLPRTVTQTLAHLGYEYPNVLKSAVKHLLLIEKGTFPAERKNTISERLTRKYLETHHQLIVDSCNFLFSKENKELTTIFGRNKWAMLVMVVLAFQSNYSQKMDEFCQHLRNGRTGPYCMHLLYRKLLENKNKNNLEIEKSYITFDLLLEGWNLFLRGDEHRVGLRNVTNFSDLTNRFIKHTACFDVA